MAHFSTGFSIFISVMSVVKATVYVIQNERILRRLCSVFHSKTTLVSVDSSKRGNRL